MANNNHSRDLAQWQKKLHVIIFGTQTITGRLFDIILIYAIILSIVAVMLESVQSIEESYGNYLRIIEWIFTILFTFEYIARILCSLHPLRYATSFMGIIDLLAFLPTYLTIILAGSQYLMVIRAIRLLRIFRILKLHRFIGEGEMIIKALKASWYKITVFIGAVLTLVTIMGTIMYLIESPEAGFTSIPRSIYWSIVTLTTVGYGDIAPQTFLGQAIASVVMIMGYAIIAVPTGIVTSEFIKGPRKIKLKNCRRCTPDDHDEDAKYCKFCGDEIDYD